MKFMLVLALVMFGSQVIQGAMSPSYPTAAGSPPSSAEDSESSEEDVIPILRDDRVHEDDGRFNLEVETANGIHLSQGGAPTGVNGSVIQAGEYSYTAPDGTPVLVKFVANENGYQPESDLLPVAPKFPHPIPQFVLDQIAFAAAQDAIDDLSEED